MEKPILRSYHGPTSPILFTWFCVEAPKLKDFDSNYELVQQEGGERRVVRMGKGPQLNMSLKRLQKETNKDGDRGMEGGRAETHHHHDDETNPTSD